MFHFPFHVIRFDITIYFKADADSLVHESCDDDVCALALLIQHCFDAGLVIGTNDIHHKIKLEIGLRRG